MVKDSPYALSGGDSSDIHGGDYCGSTHDGGCCSSTGRGGGSSTDGGYSSGHVPDQQIQLCKTKPASI